MFNFGLRVARNLYSTTFEYVEEPTWENSRTDLQLSLTNGVATSFFVGLLVAVGVHEDDSVLPGALKAGLSTAMGFVVAQTVFNVVFPSDKCWID